MKFEPQNKVNQHYNEFICHILGVHNNLIDSEGIHTMADL